MGQWLFEQEAKFALTGVIDMEKFEDLKSLTEKEKIILKRCCDAIYQIEPDAKVILYGSRARGDSTSESDYDLLIVTNRDLDLEREDIVRRQLFPIELEAGVVLTVNFYSHQKWDSSLYRAMPFHWNVERDGVIL